MQATGKLTEQPSGWRGSARLRFHQREGGSTYQGGAQAPLKLLRSFNQSSGHCELPLLHTAGGLVGGDQLLVEAQLEPGSRALITSVAAQKVYGSVGRSEHHPKGRWSHQQLNFQLAENSDMEWLPQELVLYANGLFQQDLTVELARGASFLSAEVVRLGRTASGEDLAAGCWRSSVEIRRNTGEKEGPRWEVVERLQLNGDSLREEHGMADQPVFGSLIWAAPAPLAQHQLEHLLQACREARRGLEGCMRCGGLEQGLVARYRGPSSQAARFWFSRLWSLIRSVRQLPPPDLPRVWPFQESPWMDGDCSS